MAEIEQVKNDKAPESTSARSLKMAEIEQVRTDKALFGKYEVGRLLGCGAFAKVYHARNIRSGQSVAVKIINKSRIPGPGLMSNIKREISIMHRLHHPYIVKLYEVLATKTKIYIVMELVKGGELFARIAKRRFSEDLARKYFHQLIAAIGYCHSRGVFHRDLKPENLLLCENGDLKITDFGLSAVTGQIRSDGLLHTLCGTPAYVAPEILLKKGYDGGKIDVWSCGIILYVMTAGYLPFNDPNLIAMYNKIYKGVFKCPKWMSNELMHFLSRLLDTNPSRRITVDEMLRDPWFKKGYKEVKFHDEYVTDAKADHKDEITDMNAFDLILFSPGLDLSGLFDDSSNAAEDGERFVSDHSPEKIIEKFEKIAQAESLGVKRKKEWGIDLEGRNGKIGIEVEIFRLTETLVITEIKRRGGDAATYNEMWKNKLMLEVNRFMASQEESSSASGV